MALKFRSVDQQLYFQYVRFPLICQKKIFLVIVLSLELFYYSIFFPMFVLMVQSLLRIDMIFNKSGQSLFCPYQDYIVNGASINSVAF